MKKLILYLFLISSVGGLIKLYISYPATLYAQAESEREIADFTHKVAAEKILADFRKIGKDAKTITILLSTFDALNAKIGTEKLSDLYRTQVEKLVEKVVEDKISYGLNNDQIRNMVNLNKRFNEFINTAISIIRTQEERR